ncbi:hypothetical protein ACLB2K_067337 [Fragaria x ananassa]
MLEVIDEEEEVILPAPAALDDTPPQVKDPVEKVNLGTEEKPMEVGLSKLLEPEQRHELIALLLEFKDCFAEKYEDILGLPTTPGERPVQQEPRRMKTETTDVVKEEVEKMFKSGIIRVAKYNEWLSNVVPVRKKNDMLIDVVPGHEMLSFMDDLRKVFELMRTHGLRMNLAKCVFGVQAGDFLGFVVHQRGIEPDIPLKLYISASENSIACLLAQDDTNQEGRTIERDIYYLSMTLLDAETRYSPIERLCLALYFVGCKLRHYMLSFTTLVVAQTDLIKYMLTRPILRGHIGKWMFALLEFSLQYTPLRAETGQAVSDFLLHHPIAEDHYFRDLDIGAIYLQPWTLYFDGSSTDKLSSADISLDWKCYLTLAHRMSIYLVTLCWSSISYEGNSSVQCISFTLVPFLERALELLDRFATVSLEHIPRERNFAANELAQIATGISLADGVRGRILKVEKQTLPSFLARKEDIGEWLVVTVNALDVDWRQLIMDYMINPSTVTDKQIRFLALNYVLKGGELLRRGEIGVEVQADYARSSLVSRDVKPSGLCAKFTWVFAKGCLECQVHGPVQHIPNIPMQPSIKSWPGRGWALDFVGFIHPYSSQQHKFILVGTDFFTKWVEAEPVKEALTKTGAAFVADETQEFLSDYGIKFLHSTPYYAQSNGQAEASIKIILSILKRMLVDNPRDWHNELDNTLWAYRTSKWTPTGTTPYALMFGHDVVLSLEINMQSLRVHEQHQLLGDDYVQAMWQEHEDLDL